MLINTSVEGQTPVFFGLLSLYGATEAEGKRHMNAGTQLAVSTLVQSRMPWQVSVLFRMEILPSPPISSINEIIPVDPPEAGLPDDSLLYRADKNHRNSGQWTMRKGMNEWVNK